VGATDCISVMVQFMTASDVDGRRIDFNVLMRWWNGNYLTA